MEGHVFRDVACGDRHIVAVTTAGAIYEWGDRRNFEPTAITLPSRYQDGLKGVHKVAAGESCSFALTVSGELYSWGRPDSGCVLTHEAHEEVVTRPRLVPPELFGDRKVLDLAVSKTRCLAITES
ncbi:E3 ubiquitin-protein ligase HERC2 (HECT domain and RCC1-like domain-containing protein 2) (HECT-type E3 ubiquitin transferase HERC2) [Durusdinium trenchii]|uniref:E3 ubiquitin-protein ligase HERC2 (HECT domain and RCC1-like domain-containing protein 2) (HECT-type E3 ubiquitin transferase HERC2) n=1 Tax=Durusdinium trenchii TaxID=1381693 RepID=A0ABP0MQ32_9DINO